MEYRQVFQGAFALFMIFLSLFIFIKSPAEIRILETPGMFLAIGVYFLGRASRESIPDLIKELKPNE